MDCLTAPGRKVGASVAAALLLGASSAAAEQTADYFTAPDGKRIDFAPFYDGWFGADRHETDLGRAVLENTIVLGIELGVYWMDFGSSVVDWQYPDLGAKFTSGQAFRLDDNLLQTNYLFHSFAGTSHYVVTRTNGFGVLGSFAAAAASSAFYELVLEWKEIVSINDLVVTPFGGSAMGEFFHQLGNYLNSEPPQVRHNVPSAVAHEGARVVVAGPRALHDVMDDPDPPPAAPPDNLGMSSAYHHRFRVVAGQDLLHDDTDRLGTATSVTGNFEIAAMPGYLRPGRFSVWFANGNFTSFDARLAYSGGTRNVEVDFDSHLFGWYGQSFRATSDGVVGQGYEVAFGTGLHYVDRQALGRLDQYGIVHLLRVTDRAHFGLGPVRLRLGVDVSPDFASLHSGAFEEFADVYGKEGAKSSLSRHGYFHGVGASAGALAAVESKGLELSARARYGRYESLDGIERVQEEVIREPHGQETLAELGARLAFDPRGTSFSAQIEAELIARGSVLGTFVEHRVNRRLTAGLGIHF